METIIDDGVTIEFDNTRWQKELRKAHVDLGDCQFPASTEIGISGTRKLVTITMREKGLHENMQTDPAAFEAWALALLLHCKVQSIQISLDPTAGTEGRHYQRFLYRLKRFSELFPGRVIPNAPEPVALESNKTRLLNQPNPREKPPEPEFTERMLTASREKRSESALEKALEVSHAFQTHFQLEKVMRQWPVGLFDGRVADGHQIFTGGKSGIDLIGIRGDTLVLFELKKDHNRKAGAISELLFYANIMRDTIGPASLFGFESNSAKMNCAISPADIIGCSKICAVLLAPDFHPLLLEPRILDELNAATGRLYVEKPIRFEAATISGYPDGKDGDFTFSNGQSEV